MFWKLAVKFRCWFPSRGMIVEISGIIWLFREIAGGFCGKLIRFRGIALFSHINHSFLGPG